MSEEVESCDDGGDDGESHERPNQNGKEVRRKVFDLGGDGAPLSLGAQSVELTQLLFHGVVVHDSLDVLRRRDDGGLGVLRRLGSRVGGRLRFHEFLGGGGDGGELVCAGGRGGGGGGDLAGLELAVIVVLAMVEDMLAVVEAGGLAPTRLHADHPASNFSVLVARNNEAVRRWRSGGALAALALAAFGAFALAALAFTALAAFATLALLAGFEWVAGGVSESLLSDDSVCS